MKKFNLLFSLLVALLLMPLLYITLRPQTTLVNTQTGSEIFTQSQISFPTTAKSACLIGANRVIASKNMSEKLPMASTTKIATAITAIMYGGDLDKTFEIDPKAVGIEGTSLYLRKGDKFSLRSLLYGLMLISGNDASVAIGCEVGRRNLSENENVSPYEKFLMLMNDTVKKFGAFNTHFDNTHGLDSSTHYTTALDLAKIAYSALDNTTFKEIVSTKNTRIESADGKTVFLKNKNKLLTLLDDCVGVKTGYTSKAGRCLVSAVENQNGRYVCVVLNCRPMFEESAEILTAVKEEYKTVNLKSLIALHEKIKVENARKDSVKIDFVKDDFSIALTENELKALTIKLNLRESLTNFVEKGKIVGKAEIYFKNCLLFSSDIVTIENVEAMSLLQKLGKFIKRFA